MKPASLCDIMVVTIGGRIVILSPRLPKLNLPRKSDTLSFAFSMRSLLYLDMSCPMVGSEFLDVAFIVCVGG